MKRYGMVIDLKPEKIEEYKKLHVSVWPEVLRTITNCNIRNYSIFLKGHTLFSYYEYVGDDFQADMDEMAADPATKEWWNLCMPCQQPLADREKGEWWASMEEIFHH